MRFPVYYNPESAWSVPPRPSNIIYSLHHPKHPLTTYLRRKWQEQSTQNRRHSKKPHVETNARSERNTEHNHEQVRAVCDDRTPEQRAQDWLSNIANEQDDVKELIMQQVLGAEGQDF